MDMLPLQAVDVPETEIDVSVLVDATDCRPVVSEEKQRFQPCRLVSQLPQPMAPITASAVGVTLPPQSPDGLGASPVSHRMMGLRDSS